MNFNSDRLKKARIYRGFTVAELADKIGCQRQTISMYENKKILSPDSSVIQKLSAILEFPIKYFYENDKDINLGTTYFRSLLTTNKRYRNENELLERVNDPDKYYVEVIMPDKLRINLEYVARHSFTFDIRLIFQTFRAIVSE